MGYYTPLAGACLRPLGHLSGAALIDAKALCKQAFYRVAGRGIIENTENEVCSVLHLVCVNVLATSVQTRHSAVRGAFMEASTMRPCVHFIGFRGEEYLSAVRVWGLPEYIHQGWDLRARREIDESDTIVFANGAGDGPPRVKSWPDLIERP